MWGVGGIVPSPMGNDCYHSIGLQFPQLTPHIFQINCDVILRSSQMNNHQVLMECDWYVAHCFNELVDMKVIDHHGHPVTELKNLTGPPVVLSFKNAKLEKGCVYMCVYIVSWHRESESLNDRWYHLCLLYASISYQEVSPY